jgi:hypothetical protein
MGGIHVNRLKTFSFLLLLIVATAINNNIIQPSVGFDQVSYSVPANEILSQQIYVQPISIGGKILDESTSFEYFRVEPGAIRLLSLTSTEQSASADIVVYRGDAVFDIPMNFYTTLAWEDICTPTAITAPWFRYRCYTITYPNQYTWETPNYIEKSVTYWDYQLKRDYLTNNIAKYSNLLVKVGVAQLPSLDLTMRNGTQAHLNFEMNQWQVMDMSATSTSSTVLEKYQDTYTSSDFDVSAEIGDLAKTTSNQFTASFSAQLKQDAQTAALANSVGFEAVRNIGTLPGQLTTAQQGTYKPVTTGNGLLFANTRPNINTPAMITLPITIAPEIGKQLEKVIITRATAEFRTASTNPYAWGPSMTYFLPEQTTSTRNIGVRVNNMNIQQRFNIKFSFWSTMTLSGASEEKSFLDIPTNERSDMVWDALITGDNKAAIYYADRYRLGDFAQDVSATGEMVSNLLGNLLTQFLPYILLAVGVYLFIQIGMPLISAKMAKNAIKPS